MTPGKAVKSLMDAFTAARQCRAAAPALEKATADAVAPVLARMREIKEAADRVLKSKDFFDWYMFSDAFCLEYSDKIRFNPENQSVERRVRLDNSFGQDIVFDFHADGTMAVTRKDWEFDHTSGDFGPGIYYRRLADKVYDGPADGARALIDDYLNAVFTPEKRAELGIDPPAAPLPPPVLS